MTSLRIQIGLRQTRRRMDARPEGAGARTLVRWAERFMARHGLRKDINLDPVVSISYYDTPDLGGSMLLMIDFWARPA